MTPIAHIAGVPVEELLPLLCTTAGVWASARVLATRLGRIAVPRRLTSRTPTAPGSRA